MWNKSCRGERWGWWAAENLGEARSGSKRGSLEAEKRAKLRLEKVERGRNEVRRSWKTQK